MTHVCSVHQSFWSGPLLQAQNQQLQLKRRNEPSSQNMNPVNVPKTVRPSESYHRGNPEKGREAAALSNIKEIQEIQGGQ